MHNKMEKYETRYYNDRLAMGGMKLGGNCKNIPRNSSGLDIGLLEYIVLHATRTGILY
jgi:hypothetical protein